MFELDLENDFIDNYYQYQNHLENLEKAQKVTDEKFFSYNTPLIELEQQLGRETEILSLQAVVLEDCLKNNPSPSTYEDVRYKLDAAYEEQLVKLLEDLRTNVREYYKARGEQIYRQGKFESLTKEDTQALTDNVLVHLETTEFNDYCSFRYRPEHLCPEQVDDWKQQVLIRVDMLASLQETKGQCGMQWVSEYRAWAALKKDLNHDWEQVKNSYQHSLCYLSGRGTLEEVQACVAGKKKELQRKYKFYQMKEWQKALNEFINQSTSTGKTALTQACLYGKVETVRYLLSVGANAQQAADDSRMKHYPLHYACRLEREQTKNLLNLLLSDQSKTHATVNMADEFGRTALHTAAIHNNSTAIQALLENGAAIDQVTNDTGYTSLHNAIIKGNFACVQILLEKKANTTIRNKNDETPLMTALIWNQETVVNYFFDQGFWLTPKDLDYLLTNNEIVETLPHVRGLLQKLNDSLIQRLQTYRVKIFLSGQGQLPGGSSLLHRYTQNSWSNNQTTTIHFDYKIHMLELNNTHLELHIRDSNNCAQRFQPIVDSAYRDIHVTVLLLDLTNKTALSAVKQNKERWLELNPKAITLLVGTKSDLIEQRVINYDDALALCEEIGAKDYLECSAKTGKGVEAIFSAAAYLYLQSLGLSEFKNYTRQAPYPQDIKTPLPPSEVKLSTAREGLFAPPKLNESSVDVPPENSPSSVERPVAKISPT